MTVSVRLHGLGVLMTMTADAKERLTIQTSPRVSFSRANLTIRNRGEPDPENRAIEIVTNSEEFYNRCRVVAVGSCSYDGRPGRLVTTGNGSY